MSARPQHSASQKGSLPLWRKISRALRVLASCAACALGLAPPSMDAHGATVTQPAPEILTRTSAQAPVSYSPILTWTKESNAVAYQLEFFSTAVKGLDPQAEDAAEHTVLVVSEHGYGKRTDFEEYRKTNRGSKGVKTLNITDKTGKVVAIKNVTDENDLMIINRSGLTIRMAVSTIKVAGRATQGVRLINIQEGDAIAAVSLVDKQEEEEPLTDGQAAAETPTQE